MSRARWSRWSYDVQDDWMGPGVRYEIFSIEPSSSQHRVLLIAEELYEDHAKRIVESYNALLDLVEMDLVEEPNAQGQ